MTQHKTIIEIPDVPCGLPKVDALLGSDFPGFQPGMLYGLASLPSQDKSSFLIAAAQTGPEDVVKAQACLDAYRENANGLLINFGGEKLGWSLLVHLYAAPSAGRTGAGFIRAKGVSHEQGQGKRNA